MTTIYKYQIDYLSNQIVSLPEGASILHAATQNGNMYLWAIVDTEKSPKERTIIVYGTGHEMLLPLNELAYISTVLDYQFVWHVFELIK